MIAFSIPKKIEVPFIIDDVTVSYVVDLDIVMGFDADGDLVAVDAGKKQVERHDKDVNARALWIAATAKINADRHLRAEIEYRCSCFEPYDNSPEALRRELGHSMRELV